MSLPITERLHAVLRKIDRPGSFCVGGSVPAVMPGLEVEGVGPIGLPLTAGQAEELKGRCEQAPYGKGTETLIDKTVREVWHLKPERFALTNPDWRPFLDETVRKVRDGLGLEQYELEAHLYDLLLYEPGGFFLPHRDGEKLARMVATLVIVLPSAHQGGELVVCHEGEERVVDFSTTPDNLFRNHFVAFYADCEHEVRPLREGHRLCLVYNLTLAKAKKAVAAPRTARHVEAAVPILREWAGMSEPRKLVVTLSHQYTQEGLTWDALKGVDAVKAKVLLEAANRSQCQVHLALLTFHESGAARYAETRGRRRGWDDEEDEEGPYEMEEVFDSDLSAEHWSDSAGGRLPIGEMDVEEAELVDPEALTKVTPREEFEGYTGNAGMTLDRWYRHGALFLWPRRRRFQILCETGRRSASESLAWLVRQWEEAGPEESAHLRGECLDFAGTLISRWPADPHSYRHAEESKPCGLLKSLATLDDPRLIGPYLTDVVAGDAAVEPGEALPRVCQKHGWGTFRPELEAVFSATARRTLERNGRILELLCLAHPRKKAGWADLCADLARKFVAALVRVDGEPIPDDYWPRKENRAALLAALARALLATGQFDELSKLVDHILASPEKYPLTATLVASLAELRPWLAEHVDRPWPPLSRWIESCREQLEALTAQEPRPPADFRRDASFAVTRNEDAAELKRFLEDPREEVHRFRVAQGRRDSLEHLIRHHHLDVKTATERKGSPHTLVCTKTDASYRAKLKTYHQDREHLAMLRSIREALPD